MKKKIIITIIALILLSGCSIKEKDEKKKTKEIYEIYKLNEETTIYSIFPNPKFIKEKGDEINLKEELNNNSISIDDIISLMDLYTTANDGGSKIYKSKNQDATIQFGQIESLPHSVCLNRGIINKMVE